MTTRKQRRGRRRTRRGMGGGATFSVVFNGTPITPRMSMAATELAPTITWDAPPPEEYRTFVCFDPDAAAKSWIHWLVLNCTGSGPSSGEELVEWAPPTPPSGSHRYIFVLFEHAYPIHMTSPERGYFNIGEFVSKWGLNQIAVTQTIVSALSTNEKKKIGCTIVTAYFNVGSKRNIDIYMEWGAVLLKMEAPIVIFTTPDYYERFVNMRGNLPIIIRQIQFDDIYMWKTYKDKWQEHYQIDQEMRYHSPELYALWANKCIWLNDVATENPFSTDFFVWCDFGLFRCAIKALKYIPSFPSLTERIPKEKILFSIVYKFEPDDFIVKNEIPGDFTLKGSDYKDRIVAGVWGGDQVACRRWKDAYETMLNKYFKVGLFAGKDLCVMASTIIENPSLAELVEPTLQYDPHGDVWFFLQDLLSNPNVVKKVYELPYPIVKSEN